MDDEQSVKLIAFLEQQGRQFDLLETQTKEQQQRSTQAIAEQEAKIAELEAQLTAQGRRLPCVDAMAVLDMLTSQFGGGVLVGQEILDRFTQCEWQLDRMQCFVRVVHASDPGAGDFQQFQDAAAAKFTDGSANCALLVTLRQVTRGARFQLQLGRTHFPTATVSDVVANGEHLLTAVCALRDFWLLRNPALQTIAEHETNFTLQAELAEFATAAHALALQHRTLNGALVARRRDLAALAVQVQVDERSICELSRVYDRFNRVVQEILPRLQHLPGAGQGGVPPRQRQHKQQRHDSEVEAERLVLRILEYYDRTKAWPKLGQLGLNTSLVRKMGGYKALLLRAKGRPSA